MQVVDACRRGNQARFINHSCEPNCETQKWMVKGELKIGFFATRAIPRGAEVQFDYNFDRFGDRPTKCHCGAPPCRGFIGGAGDRYVGQAVDDAAMIGLELPPIMLTGALRPAATRCHHTSLCKHGPVCVRACPWGCGARGWLPRRCDGSLCAARSRCLAFPALQPTFVCCAVCCAA